MNAVFLINGFIAGLIATVIMTIFQIPIWKKWGMTSVLEWHENQVLTSRIINKTPDDLLIQSFFFHFLHGSLGGIGVAIVVKSINLQISYLISGIVLGFLFTLIVLIIHEPITKIKPLRHPLGKLPVLASFVTHAIYGASLGYFLTFSDYFISVFLP